MLRLVGLLYGIVASGLAGAGVIAVLALEASSFMPILAAAITGAIVALPTTYFVASRVFR